MTLPLLDTFRVLSSLEPVRQSLADAPWKPFVDWAIAQGVAPLAAYNLEYRLAGAGAPDWARERLLSVYQGSVNDNVMKLVGLKRSLSELQGRKLLLTGAASYAEVLYPHVGFRPVSEIELEVAAADLEGLCGYLKQFELKPLPAEALEVGERELAPGDRLLSDGHATLILSPYRAGESTSRLWAGAMERALPMRVYGPSVFRLDLEDAMLCAALQLARRGYEAPAIAWVDFRELLLGAPATGGPYSREVDFQAVLEIARASRLERALYVALAVVQRLFPHVTGAATRATPPLRAATRTLLNRWVVEPVSALESSGAMRRTRGLGRLRKLLSAAG